MKRLLIGMAWVAAAAAGVGACGGDDDDKADVSAFVGQWNVTQGAVNMTCTALGPVTANVSGSATITAGTASDIVVTFSDPSIANCAVQMNIKDNVASAVAGQTCTFMLQGATGTLEVTSGTLSPTGATAAMNINAKANAAQGPFMVMCNGALTGNLVRGTTPDGGGGDATSGN